MSDRLSIIIVNWNTRDDLRDCLSALHRHPYTLGPREIIVVDNGSRDGSAQMVRDEFSGAVLIANTENELYARATNQGLAQATGDYLLLLNPDAQVQAGTLDTLVTATRPLPVFGAIAPTLRYADGTVQPSVRGFPRPGSLLYEIVGLARWFPNSPRYAAYRQPFFDYTRKQTAEQPMASCFLISRKAYEAVGGMDERFPLYFNDADWCLRCWEAGASIWYTPETSVTHGYGGTTKKVRRAAVWESHRSLLRFLNKHYRDTPWPLYTLLTVLIILGAWVRTKRWGESLGKHGGETTPADLRRQLEREG